MHTNFVPRLHDLFERMYACIERDHGAWGQSYNMHTMYTYTAPKEHAGPTVRYVVIQRLSAKSRLK